jgi:hypothetical protein
MSTSELAELICASRAVVDAFEEEIPGIGAMPTKAIERLRKACESDFIKRLLSTSNGPLVAKRPALPSS